MPNKQATTVNKTIIKLVDQHLLSLFVKVDHDIAAENKIESFSKWKGVHEIESPKFDHVPYGPF